MCAVPRTAPARTHTHTFHHSVPPSNHLFGWSTWCSAVTILTNQIIVQWGLSAARIDAIRNSLCLRYFGAEQNKTLSAGTVRSQPRKPAVPWAASPAVWAQGEGGGSAPLLCSGDTPQESCVQLWSPQHRTELELLERGQRRPQQ